MSSVRKTLDLFVFKESSISLLSLELRGSIRRLNGVRLPLWFCQREDFMLECMGKRFWDG